MTRLLPDVLFPGTRLSLAELCAARLDGELVAVDVGFTPVDCPETATVRLQALAPLLPESAIVERQSALWIYGFRPYPPARHQACVAAGSRRRAPSSARLQVRELVLHDDDIVRLGGIPVTSMLRTVVDLARSLPHIDETEHEQLRELARASGATLATCLRQLERCRNLPNKTRAAARLRTIYAREPTLSPADTVHVVHGVDAAHRIQHPVEVGRVAHFEHEPADRQAIA